MLENFQTVDKRGEKSVGEFKATIFVGSPKASKTKQQQQQRNKSIIGEI